MPTYEYACQACGHDLELFQRMSDNPLEVCPQCEESSLKRKIGLGAGIIFKGGGFYETDFKQKKGTAPESESAKASEKTEASSPPASSDSSDKSASIASKEAAS